ncbi:MAG: beta-ketoacyl-ACP synthase II [Alphaproteobacteria bacterium]
MRRVVITGLGIVSPLGANVEKVWQKLLNGESGIKKIDTFETDDLAAQIAGSVALGSAEDGLFDPDLVMPAKDRRKNDNFIVYGLGAADQALEDAGWVADTDEKAWRTGVMMGSGIGGVQTVYDWSVHVESKGPRRASPFLIPASLINLISGQVSIKHNLKGPNHSVVTACATGTHAVGDAARLIALDDADVMIAGGAEFPITRLGMAGFAAARALSTAYNDAPQDASRPWDKGRDGFVMGAGAGALVLEELEHAKKRGAKIYGEIVGYGLSGDSHHITAPPPDGNGGYRAMQAALKRAGMDPSDIDYINAHGTSTPLGDMIELGAVKQLFGSAMSGVTMSSTKSAIGHLLGAAGAVEAIFCALSMRDGVCPPTLNLNDPDEGTEGVDLAPLVAKERKIDAALSNSFGFGGTNASIIMKKLA